ncbi:hypothetical protein F2Q68_00020460 [Brassica cretica]|uniref:Uncharacterized protein n=1 Tax=Brassica cretica TaxID=69181 RepID=A0A8S9FZV4_BRACR|nr:hypothetical protein F2Q68_00020460 [Brassica cretica]
MYRLRVRGNHRSSPDGGDWTPFAARHRKANQRPPRSQMTPPRPETGDSEEKPNLQPTAKSDKNRE